MASQVLYTALPFHISFLYASQIGPLQILKYVHGKYIHLSISIYVCVYMYIYVIYMTVYICHVYMLHI